MLRENTLVFKELQRRLQVHQLRRQNDLRKVPLLEVDEALGVCDDPGRPVEAPVQWAAFEYENEGVTDPSAQATSTRSLSLSIDQNVKGSWSRHKDIKCWLADNTDDVPTPRSSPPMPEKEVASPSLRWSDFEDDSLPDVSDLLPSWANSPIKEQAVDTNLPIRTSVDSDVSLHTVKDLKDPELDPDEDDYVMQLVSMISHLN